MAESVVSTRYNYASPTAAAWGPQADEVAFASGAARELPVAGNLGAMFFSQMKRGEDVKQYLSALDQYNAQVRSAGDKTMDFEQKQNAIKSVIDIIKDQGAAPYLPSMFNSLQSAFTGSSNPNDATRAGAWGNLDKANAGSVDAKRAQTMKTIAEAVKAFTEGGAGIPGGTGTMFPPSRFLDPNAPLVVQDPTQVRAQRELAPKTTVELKAGDLSPKGTIQVPNDAGQPQIEEQIRRMQGAFGNTNRNPGGSGNVITPPQVTPAPTGAATGVVDENIPPSFQPGVKKIRAAGHDIEGPGTPMPDGSIAYRAKEKKWVIQLWPNGNVLFHDTTKK